MARKNLENITKGDIVFYVYPSKTFRSYGEYKDVEFKSGGDIAIIQDRITTPGKMIKIPMKKILSVMDNIFQDKQENNINLNVLAEAEKSIASINKEIKKAGNDLLASIEKQIKAPAEKTNQYKTTDISDKVKTTSVLNIKDFLKNEEWKEDDKHLNVLDVKELRSHNEFIQNTFQLVVTIPETSVIYDDKFTSSDFVPFNANIRLNPVTNRLDVQLENPINQNISIDISGAEPLDVLGRTLKRIEELVLELAADLKYNKETFAIKYGNLLKDAAAAVNESIYEAGFKYQEFLKEDLGPNSKYRLTDESRTVNGVKCYRIEAIKDFGEIKTGDKGGYIEKESNLSQYGNCWIYDNAVVYGAARIKGNGVKVSGEAKIYGEETVINSDYPVVITDNAEIAGGVRITNASDVNISGEAKLTGDLDITGKVSISGKAVINPSTSIGRLRISGSHRGIVKIYDTAKIECMGYIDANGETITINGKSHLTGSISIINECQIFDMGIDGTFDFDLKKSKIKIVSPDTVGEKNIIGRSKKTITSIEDIANAESLKDIAKQQLKESIEVAEDIINGDQNLEKWFVKNPRWYQGVAVPDNKLSDEQRAYLNSLDYESLDSDFEMENWQDWYEDWVYEKLIKDGDPVECIIEIAGQIYWTRLEDNGRCTKIMRLNRTFKRVPPHHKK